MLKSFRQTEHTLVAQRFMVRHLWHSFLQTFTRPLVQRLLLLALSTLVAMCLGESLLLQTVHPLTPALSIMHVGMPLVSGGTRQWGPALTLWKGGQP